MADGNDILELGFEDTAQDQLLLLILLLSHDRELRNGRESIPVKVLTGPYSNERIRVRQSREDADFV